MWGGTAAGDEPAAVSDDDRTAVRLSNPLGKRGYLFFSTNLDRIASGLAAAGGQP
jgi:hypothetical protein